MGIKGVSFAFAALFLLTAVGCSVDSGSGTENGSPKDPEEKPRNTPPSDKPGSQPAVPPTEPFTKGAIPGEDSTTSARRACLAQTDPSYFWDGKTCSKAVIPQTEALRGVKLNIFEASRDCLPVRNEHGFGVARTMKCVFSPGTVALDLSAIPSLLRLKGTKMDVHLLAKSTCNIDMSTFQLKVSVNGAAGLWPVRDARGETRRLHYRGTQTFDFAQKQEITLTGADEKSTFSLPINACRIDIVDFEVVPLKEVVVPVFRELRYTGNDAALAGVHAYVSDLKTSLVQRKDAWNEFDTGFGKVSDELASQLDAIQVEVSPVRSARGDLAEIFDHDSSKIRCAFSDEYFNFHFGVFGRNVIELAPNQFEGMGCDLILVPTEGSENSTLQLAEVRDADSGEVFASSIDQRGLLSDSAIKRSIRFNVKPDAKRILVRIEASNSVSLASGSFELNRLSEGWRKMAGEPSVLGFDSKGDSSLPPVAYFLRKDAQSRLVVGSSDWFTIEVPIKNENKLSLEQFKFPEAKVTFADEMADKCVGRWPGHVMAIDNAGGKALVQVFADFKRPVSAECESFVQSLTTHPLKSKFSLLLSPVFDVIEVELPPIVAYTQPTQIFNVTHAVDSTGELIEVKVKNAAPFNIFLPRLKVSLQCKDDRPGRSPMGSVAITNDLAMIEMPIGGELQFGAEDIKKSLLNYLESLPGDSALKGCQKPLIVTDFTVSQGVQSILLGYETFAIESEKIILTP